MDREKVLNLAKLARIKISDEEAESLSKELGSILEYVAQVDKVNKLDKSNKEEYATKNTMREDGEGHESGIYTEKILRAAPHRSGNYIKVKKIL